MKLNQLALFTCVFISKTEGIIIYPETGGFKQINVRKVIGLNWNIVAASKFQEFQYPLDIFGRDILNFNYYVQVMYLESFYIDLRFFCMKVPDEILSDSRVSTIYTFSESFFIRRNKKSLRILKTSMILDKNDNLCDVKPETDVDLVIYNNYWFLIGWKLINGTLYFGVIIFAREDHRNNTNEILNSFDEIIKDYIKPVNGVLADGKLKFNTHFGTNDEKLCYKPRVDQCAQKSDELLHYRPPSALAHPAMVFALMIVSLLLLVFIMIGFSFCHRN